jgi:hypothetical protein
MDGTASIPAASTSEKPRSGQDSGWGFVSREHRSEHRTALRDFGHPTWGMLLGALIIVGILALLIAFDGTAEARPNPWVPATATWYGPGFYGNRTACGQRYTKTIRGTAHMSLPCGAKVSICKPVGRWKRCVYVRVIDRGAFHPGNFDLSARTAMDLCRCWQPYTQRVSWRKGWPS